MEKFLEHFYVLYYCNITRRVVDKGLASFSVFPVFSWVVVLMDIVLQVDIHHLN